MLSSIELAILKGVSFMDYKFIFKKFDIGNIWFSYLFKFSL